MQYYVELQVFPYTQKFQQGLQRQQNVIMGDGSEAPVLLTQMVVDVDDRDNDLLTSIIPERKLDSGTREALRRVRKYLQNLLRVADKIDAVPTNVECVLYDDKQ